MMTDVRTEQASGLIDLHVLGRQSGRMGRPAPSRKEHLLALKSSVAGMIDAGRRATERGNESAGRHLGRDCVEVFTRFGISAALPVATRLSWNYSADWLTDCENLVALCERVLNETENLLASV